MSVFFDIQNTIVVNTLYVLPRLFCALLDYQQGIDQVFLLSPCYVSSMHFRLFSMAMLRIQQIF